MANPGYDEKPFLDCTGNTITFFTARNEKHRDVTEDWLNKHGFKYNSLLMNKPRGGNYIWIDNLSVKGIHYKNNWDKWNRLYW